MTLKTIEHAGFLSILTLSVISLYFPTLQNGFIWDDRAAIVTNKDVQGVNSLSELFQHDFWGQNISLASSHKSYRPVTTLSYRLDYAIHGFDGYGFHLSNIIVYLSLSIAAYLFYSQILSTTGARVASLLFVFHPIHVEVVASLVGRADSICGFFFLLAALCYRCDYPQYSIFLKLSAYTFGLLASLSKEIGGTIFGYFVILEAINIFNSLKSGRGLIKPANAFFRPKFSNEAILILSSIIVFALFLAIRLSMNGRVLYQWSVSENHIHHFNQFKERALSYAQCHFWYAWKLLYPRFLCFDYGFDCLPAVYELSDIRNAFPLAVYSTLLVLISIGLKGSHDYLLIGVALIVLPLVPASNALFPVGTILAERLLLIPSVGVCMVMGELLAKGIDMKCVGRRLIVRTLYLAVLISPVLFCWAIVVQGRNSDWKSEERMYKSALNICPTSIKALSNYAALHVDDYNRNTSLIALRRAKALYPQSATLGTHGMILAGQSSWVESLVSLETAYREYRNEGGRIVSTLVQWSEKLAADYSRSLKTRSIELIEQLEIEGKGSARLYHAHGSLALDKMDYETAVRILLLALNTSARLRELSASGLRFEDSIEDAFAYNQLGNAYAGMNKLEQAIDAYRKAILANPKVIAPYSNLGSLLRNTGNFAESVEVMTRGIAEANSADEDLPALYNNIGLSYADLEVYEAALSAFEKASNSCMSKSNLCNVISNNAKNVQARMLQHEITLQVV